MPKVETVCEVANAMRNDEDQKVRDYALRIDTANYADHFALSVRLGKVEASLRWIADAVGNRWDGSNRYGLAQLIAEEASRLNTLSHTYLHYGNGDEA